MARQQRRLLILCGGAIVIYSVLVLGFVATSPDVRLRCLLVDNDEPSETSSPVGVTIRAVPGLKREEPNPQTGDVLLKIGEHRIRHFLDFTQALSDLRNAPIPPGGLLHPGADPLELDFSLPPLVKKKNGPRLVRIVYWRNETSSRATSWLPIRSLPVGEVVLSFVWFLLEFGIFVVAALAYWYRPFDRPARLFFAMCIVTLGAFVGGYHWWVLAESFWLSIPFVVCAVLVPVVTLHFFLIFPRPKPLLSRRPRTTLIGLYAVPVLAMLSILAIQTYSRWLTLGEPSDLQAANVREALGWLRGSIYVYLTIAGLYFLGTVVALIDSFFTTWNPLEHTQVKWILSAGLLATIPVTYTIYLAHFERVGFALGDGRVPMFLASLSFMLAYAVAIGRYKLMLVDQIISKGMAYYTVSCGLTVLFALLIALSSVVPQLLNISLSPVQLLAVCAILILSVILLLWLRDRFQQMIDRRFFREKYQLDKALQRMNRAVGRLVDPEALAEMMLGSCRDVLRVDQAALYLRSSAKGAFQLIAVEGLEGIPWQFPSDGTFAETLMESGSLQRVTPGTRSQMSGIQNFLRELQADLVHALEVDGEIAGVVVLGEKRNGASFTAEDLTFLNALGQITNVALHSAHVHQDMTRLNEELQLKVERISTQKRQIAMLQSELTERQPHGGNRGSTSDGDTFRRDALKGDGPAIQRVLETVRKVAGSDSSVLLRGESGTGKELLAHVIHENSPRHEGPMIRVHCASLSAGLLESELFGHVKGAFTGAHRDKVGRFEAANGGTLFLDEIGDISLETQIKLLRVLQERCFEPVGGSQTIHVDVRVIAATHQNLEKLIAEGRFREDLYYRLNVISITLPALRQRREDLFELAFYFLNRAAGRAGKSITHIEEEAIAALEQYHWPGNIRELENTIERAVVLAEEESIRLEDLPVEIQQATRRIPSDHLEESPSVQSSSGSETDHSTMTDRLETASVNGRLPLKTNSPDSEPRRLQQALRECHGNKAQAARLLGMPRSTFYSKLKKYAIG